MRGRKESFQSLSTNLITIHMWQGRQLQSTRYLIMWSTHNIPIFLTPELVAFRLFIFVLGRELVASGLDRSFTFCFFEG
eukprot:6208226-Pleurochrysis_carterae.AAC.1